LPLLLNLADGPVSSSGHSRRVVSRSWSAASRRPVPRSKLSWRPLAIPLSLRLRFVCARLFVSIHSTSAILLSRDSLWSLTLLQLSSSIFGRLTNLALAKCSNSLISRLPFYRLQFPFHVSHILFSLFQLFLHARLRLLVRPHATRQIHRQHLRMSTLLEDPEYDFPEEYVPNDPSLGNIYRRFTVVWTAIAIFDTVRLESSPPRQVE